MENQYPKISRRLARGAEPDSVEGVLEPTDNPLPTVWILDVGGKRYPWESRRRLLRHVARYQMEDRPDGMPGDHEPVLEAATHPTQQRGRGKRSPVATSKIPPEGGARPCS
jgi:hypothetical protein